MSAFCCSVSDCSCSSDVVLDRGRRSAGRSTAVCYTLGRAGEAIDVLRRAIASVVKSKDCAYVQATVITLDGDDATYTLNDQGALVESSPEVATEGCVEEASPADPDLITTQAVAIGNKDFTYASPGFTATDGNGTFVAQSNTVTRTLQWGYNVSGPLRVIATGTAAASVVRVPADCTYNKVGVSAAYAFHGSCPTHTWGTPYKLNGVITFPIQVAGNPGTATIDWVFNYRILSI